MSRLSGLFQTQLPGVRLAADLSYLRPPERADWADWCELRSESRAFLTPWEPTWTSDALTRTAFRRRLARYASDWRNDEGYAFFIFRTGDNQLVGGITLSNVRRGVAETASVGYWTGVKYARQGHMTEGLSLVANFAFERLRLHRLEAACLPTNQPSRGLLEKIGFRKEGYAKSYLCINGQWQDHLLFGLLREEWPALRKAGQRASGVA